MLKIFIAEDESRTLNSIIKIVENYCAETIIKGHAKDVKKSVEFLSNNSVDLVLFDINFPDGTGFDILKQLKTYNFKVIFITAHDKYALKAIKISAVDYLVKPVNPKELIAAINKVRNEIDIKKFDYLKIESLISNFSPLKKAFEKIVVKTSERIIVIDLHEIVRCESDNSYTTFYLNNKKKVVSSKGLKEYAEILNESGFIRTHKSHLVNLNFIKTFEKSGGGFLILKDLERIPVSVRRKEYVLRTLNQF